MSEREQKIMPYLWFDDQAEEAANFYVDVFSSHGLPARLGPVMRYHEPSADAPGQMVERVVNAEFFLGDYRVIGLNGGPEFKLTPAVSLFVTCNTVEQVNGLYEALVDGGMALMPLDSYPFSERYAWINDKYGVSWQLFKGTANDPIIPALLFVGEQSGRAEEAMNLYTSLFEDAAVGDITRYGPEHGVDEGNIAHATFTLAGQQFSAADSSLNHEFGFSEATSLFVRCADQEEVDHFWYKLIADGGEESMCGWLKDKFGVSWQIIPERLMELLSDPDPDRARRATEAMLQMQKIDVAALEAAAEG